MLCNNRNQKNSRTNKKTNEQKMTGKLTIVMGPMFAGKTTELQRRIKREIHACRRVCIIKYGKDDRYSKSLLATHDQSPSSADTMTVLPASAASVQNATRSGKNWPSSIATVS